MDTNRQVDASAESLYTLKGQFIYRTIGDASIAEYHIATRNTRSGIPLQLMLSHLLPSESRRLSQLQEIDTEQPFIKYDEDLTLYAGEKLSVPISIGFKPLICIRGRQRGTLKGSIVLEQHLDRGRRLFKFWHLTPIRRELTSAEIERHQALMHKRGYHSSDDWKKEVLFTVQQQSGKQSREMQWTNPYGEIVATGMGGRSLRLREADIDVRDLLMSCWASMSFILDRSVGQEKTATRLSGKWLSQCFSEQTSEPDLRRQ